MSNKNPNLSKILGKKPSDSIKGNKLKPKEVDADDYTGKVKSKFDKDPDGIPGEVSGIYKGRNWKRGPGRLDFKDESDASILQQPKALNWRGDEKEDKRGLKPWKKVSKYDSLGHLIENWDEPDVSKVQDKARKKGIPTLDKNGNPNFGVTAFRYTGKHVSKDIPDGKNKYKPDLMKIDEATGRNVPPKGPKGKERYARFKNPVVNLLKIVRKLKDYSSLSEAYREKHMEVEHLTMTIRKLYYILIFIKDQIKYVSDTEDHIHELLAAITRETTQWERFIDKDKLTKLKQRQSALKEDRNKLEQVFEVASKSILKKLKKMGASMTNIVDLDNPKIGKNYGNWNTFKDIDQYKDEELAELFQEYNSALKGQRDSVDLVLKFPGINLDSLTEADKVRLENAMEGVFTEAVGLTEDDKAKYQMQMFTRGDITGQKGGVQIGGGEKTYKYTKYIIKHGKIKSLSKLETGGMLASKVGDEEQKAAHKLSFEEEITSAVVKAQIKVNKDANKGPLSDLLVKRERRELNGKTSHEIGKGKLIPAAPAAAAPSDSPPRDISIAFEVPLDTMSKSTPAPANPEIIRKKLYEILMKRLKKYLEPAQLTAVTIKYGNKTLNDTGTLTGGSSFAEIMYNLNINFPAGISDTAINEIMQSLSINPLEILDDTTGRIITSGNVVSGVISATSKPVDKDGFAFKRPSFEKAKRLKQLYSSHDGDSEELFNKISKQILILDLNEDTPVQMSDKLREYFASNLGIESKDKLGVSVDKVSYKLGNVQITGNDLIRIISDLSGIEDEIQNRILIADSNVFNAKLTSILSSDRALMESQNEVFTDAKKYRDERLVHQLAREVEDREHCTDKWTDVVSSNWTSKNCVNTSDGPSPVACSQTPQMESKAPEPCKPKWVPIKEESDKTIERGYLKPEYHHQDGGNNFGWLVNHNVSSDNFNKLRDVIKDSFNGISKGDLETIVDAYKKDLKGGASIDISSGNIIGLDISRFTTSKSLSIFKQILTQEFEYKILQNNISYISSIKGVYSFQDPALWNADEAIFTFPGFIQAYDEKTGEKDHMEVIQAPLADTKHLKSKLLKVMSRNLSDFKGIKVKSPNGKKTVDLSEVLEYHLNLAQDPIRGDSIKTRHFGHEGRQGGPKNEDQAGGYFDSKVMYDFLNPRAAKEDNQWQDDEIEHSDMDHIPYDYIKIVMAIGGISEADGQLGGSSSTSPTPGDPMDDRDQSNLRAKYNKLESKFCSIHNKSICKNNIINITNKITECLLSKSNLEYIGSIHMVLNDLIEDANLSDFEFKKIIEDEFKKRPKSHGKKKILDIKEISNLPDPSKRPGIYGPRVPDFKLHQQYIDVIDKHKGNEFEIGDRHGLSTLILDITKLPPMFMAKPSVIPGSQIALSDPYASENPIDSSFDISILFDNLPNNINNVEAMRTIKNQIKIHVGKNVPMVLYEVGNDEEQKKFDIFISEVSEEEEQNKIAARARREQKRLKSQQAIASASAVSGLQLGGEINIKPPRRFVLSFDPDPNMGITKADVIRINRQLEIQPLLVKGPDGRIYRSASTFVGRANKRRIFNRIINIISKNSQIHNQFRSTFGPDSIFTINNLFTDVNNRQTYAVHCFIKEPNWDEDDDEEAITEEIRKSALSFFVALIESLKKGRANDFTSIESENPSDVDGRKRFFITKIQDRRTIEDYDYSTNLFENVRDEITRILWHNTTGILAKHPVISLNVNQKLVEETLKLFFYPKLLDGGVSNLLDDLEETRVNKHIALRGTDFPSITDGGDSAPMKLVRQLYGEGSFSFDNSLIGYLMSRGDFDSSQGGGSYGVAPSPSPSPSGQDAAVVNNQFTIAQTNPKGEKAEDNEGVDTRIQGLIAIHPDVSSTKLDQILDETSKKESKDIIIYFPQTSKMGQPARGVIELTILNVEPASIPQIENLVLEYLSLDSNTPGPDGKFIKFNTIINSVGIGDEGDPKFTSSKGCSVLAAEMLEKLESFMSTYTNVVKVLKIWHRGAANQDNVKKLVYKWVFKDKSGKPTNDFQECKNFLSFYNDKSTSDVELEYSDKSPKLTVLDNDNYKKARINGAGLKTYLLMAEWYYAANILQSGAASLREYMEVDKEGNLKMPTVEKLEKICCGAEDDEECNPIKRFLGKNIEDMRNRIYETTQKIKKLSEGLGPNWNQRIADDVENFTGAVKTVLVYRDDHPVFTHKVAGVIVPFGPAVGTKTLYGEGTTNVPGYYCFRKLGGEESGPATPALPQPASGKYEEQIWDNIYEYNISGTSELKDIRYHKGVPITLMELNRRAGGFSSHPDFVSSQIKPLSIENALKINIDSDPIANYKCNSVPCPDIPQSEEERYDSGRFGDVIKQLYEQRYVVRFNKQYNTPRLNNLVPSSGTNSLAPYKSERISKLIEDKISSSGTYGPFAAVYNEVDQNRQKLGDGTSLGGADFALQMWEGKSFILPKPDPTTGEKYRKDEGMKDMAMKCIYSNTEKGEERKGINLTTFGYGFSGSGKTFLLLANANSLLQKSLGYLCSLRWKNTNPPGPNEKDSFKFVRDSTGMPKKFDWSEALKDGNVKCVRQINLRLYDLVPTGKDAKIIGYKLHPKTFNVVNEIMAYKPNEEWGINSYPYDEELTEMPPKELQGSGAKKNAKDDLKNIYTKESTKMFKENPLVEKVETFLPTWRLSGDDEKVNGIVKVKNKRWKKPNVTGIDIGAKTYHNDSNFAPNTDVNTFNTKAKLKAWNYKVERGAEVLMSEGEIDPVKDADLLKGLPIIRLFEIDKETGAVLNNGDDNPNDKKYDLSANISEITATITKCISCVTRRRMHTLRITPTPNNPTSSRAHLFVEVEIIDNSNKEISKCNKTKITIVDMAGSENTKQIKDVFFSDRVAPFCKKLVSSKLITGSKMNTNMAAGNFDFEKGDVSSETWPTVPAGINSLHEVANTEFTMDQFIKDYDTLLFNIGLDIPDESSRMRKQYDTCKKIALLFEELSAVNTSTGNSLAKYLASEFMQNLSLDKQSFNATNGIDGSEALNAGRASETNYLTGFIANPKEKLTPFIINVGGIRCLVLAHPADGGSGQNFIMFLDNPSDYVVLYKNSSAGYEEDRGATTLEQIKMAYKNALADYIEIFSDNWSETVMNELKVGNNWSEVKYKLISEIFEIIGKRPQIRFKDVTVRDDMPTDKITDTNFSTQEGILMTGIDDEREIAKWTSGQCMRDGDNSGGLEEVIVGSGTYTPGYHGGTAPATGSKWPANSSGVWSQGGNTGLPSDAKSFGTNKLTDQIIKNIEVFCAFNSIINPLDLQAGVLYGIPDPSSLPGLYNQFTNKIATSRMERVKQLLGDGENAFSPSYSTTGTKEVVKANKKKAELEGSKHYVRTLFIKPRSSSSLYNADGEFYLDPTKECLMPAGKEFFNCLRLESSTPSMPKQFDNDFSYGHYRRFAGSVAVGNFFPARGRPVARFANHRELMIKLPKSLSIGKTNMMSINPNFQYQVNYVNYPLHYTVYNENGVRAKLVPADDDNVDASFSKQNNRELPSDISSLYSPSVALLETDPESNGIRDELNSDNTGYMYYSVSPELMGRQGPKASNTDDVVKNCWLLCDAPVYDQWFLLRSLITHPILKDEYDFLDDKLLKYQDPGGPLTEFGRLAPNQTRYWGAMTAFKTNPPTFALQKVTIAGESSDQKGEATNKGDLNEMKTNCGIMGFPLIRFFPENKEIKGSEAGTNYKGDSTKRAGKNGDENDTFFNESGSKITRLEGNCYTLMNFMVTYMVTYINIVASQGDGIVTTLEHLKYFFQKSNGTKLDSYNKENRRAIAEKINEGVSIPYKDIRFRDMGKHSWNITDENFTVQGKIADDEPLGSHKTCDLRWSKLPNIYNIKVGNSIETVESGRFVDYEIFNALTGLGSTDANVKSKYIMMACINRGKWLTGNLDVDQQMSEKYVDAALNTLRFADSVCSTSEASARTPDKKLSQLGGSSKKRRASKKRNRVYGRRKTLYKRKTGVNKKKSKLRSGKTLSSYKRR